MNNWGFRNIVCYPKVFLIISTVDSQFEYEEKPVYNLYARPDKESSFS